MVDFLNLETHVLHSFRTVDAALRSLSTVAQRGDGWYIIEILGPIRARGVGQHVEYVRP